MKSYFGLLAEYIRSVALRWDTGCGIIVGIILFLILVIVGADVRVGGYISVALILVLLFEATYGVYQGERKMRSEREKMVRVRASPARYALDITLEQTVTLDAQVHWEIWADQPVWTDEISLVVSVESTVKRFKFLKRRLTKRLLRIPPDVSIDTHFSSWHKGHYEYRQKISADHQPLRGSARFYVKEFPVELDKREFGWTRQGFLNYTFELVLKTGSPSGEYRAPVQIERRRGAALARSV